MTGEWSQYIKDALKRCERYEELLNIYTQQRNWIEAIELVNSRIEAQDKNFDPSLRIKTLKNMVNTLELKSEERKIKEKRQLLCDFIFQTTQLEEWEISQENIREAGKAFTQIGDFQSKREFYERFREHTDSNICKFVHSQWLELNRIQISRLEKAGKHTRVQELKQEVEDTEKTWLCSSQPSPELTLDALRRIVGNRLDKLSKDELNYVNHYISFLEFKRD